MFWADLCWHSTNASKLFDDMVLIWKLDFRCYVEGLGLVLTFSSALLDLHYVSALEYWYEAVLSGTN